jgi:hypothetical protein
VARFLASYTILQKAHMDALKQRAKKEAPVKSAARGKAAPPPIKTE